MYINVNIYFEGILDFGWHVFDNCYVRENLKESFHIVHKNQDDEMAGWLVSMGLTKKALGVQKPNHF